MYGNECLSECLYNVIVVRRLWTVEKDVYGLTTKVRDNDIISSTLDRKRTTQRTRHM